MSSLLISIATTLLIAGAQSSGSTSSVGQGNEEENTMREDSISTGDSIGPAPAITVIYDNNVYTEGLKPEWGFACLIEFEGSTILFDTGGDGSILMQNMAELNIDPEDVDIVVLSHEHWDHVGGLQSFLEKNARVTIRMPESFSNEFKAGVRHWGADVISVSESSEIMKNVFTTGEMGSRIIEQSLILETNSGSVVITGCAHPGIVEIVERAKEVVDDDILLVMGGFHLISHSESQINTIVRRFRELGVKYAAPCHCSGDEARTIFKDEYGSYFIDIGTGRVIAISDLD